MKTMMKATCQGLLAAAALAVATPTLAATETVDALVVTGTITDDPVSIDYWLFEVSTPGIVSIDVLSLGVLGGDAGQSGTESRLDSVILLFDYDSGGDLGMLGALVGANDDGGAAGFGDGSTSGLDSFLSLSLGAGSYVLSISDYIFTTDEARLGLDTGSSFSGTYADYQLTFTGIDVAPVPLPAALPLLLGGLGVMGFVGRRRSKKNTSA